METLVLLIDMTLSEETIMMYIRYGRGCEIGATGQITLNTKIMVVGELKFVIDGQACMVQKIFLKIWGNDPDPNIL